MLRLALDIGAWDFIGHWVLEIGASCSKNKLQDVANFGEEGVTVLPLDVLHSERVVAQVEPFEFLPEGRTCLAEAVSLRHRDLDAAARHAVVLLSGEAVAVRVRLTVGLEHSRVHVLCMSANAFGSDWSQLESGTFRFRDPLNKERRFIPCRWSRSRTSCDQQA